MKPTEIEQLLIDYLTLSKARTGASAMVFVLLEKKEQQVKMCEFLSANEEATEEEILERAKKIVSM